MFGSEKRRAALWADAVTQLNAGKLTMQQFVNRTEKCVLYYSTPFGTDARTGRDRPFALSRTDTETLFFPAFTSPDKCRTHFEAANRDGFLVIKGTVADALSALDTHPVIAAWGLVVDPGETGSVCVPPRVRVQPKCLRD